MVDGVKIDPWSSSQSTDYSGIIQQFGLQKMDLVNIPNPSMLHRRGIVFAHRDFDRIARAQHDGEKYGVLTGLMPSGKMHLGHKMVIDQVKWFQENGGDVTIAVADLEAHATRGYSLEDCKKYALDEYVANYVAMGLDPERTSVYFQSKRSIVQKLGFSLGKKTNLSEFESIYGFEGDTNLAHVQAPLVQAGDILHPMLDEYGGLRPIVVPVGVDQDPHLRLCRDLVTRSNWFNVKERKNGGLVVGLSIQDENSTTMGVLSDGKIDRNARDSIINKVVNSISSLGFSDILPNPKHGTVEIPSATSKDKDSIKIQLLRIERNLGGMGLLQPSSTYHRFAMGLTGDKMSSSKPNTTLFLSDSLDLVEKKIKSAYSGGKATLEEHRKLGGNPEVDVAYQYLMFFFESDDNVLTELNKNYRNGKILAGEMKQICIDAAKSWFIEHNELKDQNSHLIMDFLD